MKLVLRFMRPADISQVVKIDQVAFETPWSARSYAYEISESSYSYMVSLEAQILPDEKGAVSGWRRLLPALSGSNRNGKIIIVGYGGLWNIMDEAHISTIATHPDWRKRRYGELLLLAMIRRSIALNAGYVVLEVRVSNTIAQQLYRKYGFEIVDTKSHYYRDNDEDAYDMRLYLDNDPLVERIKSQFDALRDELNIDDLYTTAPRPRFRL